MIPRKKAVVFGKPCAPRIRGDDPIPFLARGFDDCVERQRQKGYNEKEAFEIAMKEYSDRFGITWEKIQ